MKFIGIIPARFASTRFPGKPLAMIGNKTMIQTVYEQVSKVLETVVVATDDERIKNHVIDFGGKVVMTSENHKSGTDRCAEAIEIVEKELNTSFDVIINIQGDEPFINPQQIESLKKCFNDSQTEIATLIKHEKKIENILNPNIVKVIFNHQNWAIYFSRSPIPFVRDSDKNKWTEKFDFHKHIGIYAYRKNILKTITNLKQSGLEIAESLEQNRWIENGFKIKIEKTDIESIGIDTIDDLEKVNNLKILNLL